MKTKVLYVDDEKINLQMFELVLAKHYDILTSTSGEEGLRHLEQDSSIDIVVSDVRMPGMDGITFVKTAKKRYRTIPYYLFSGYDMTPEIVELKKNRVILDYVSKPFDMKGFHDLFERDLKGPGTDGD